VQSLPVGRKTAGDTVSKAVPWMKAMQSAAWTSVLQRRNKLLYLQATIAEEQPQFGQVMQQLLERCASSAHTDVMFSALNSHWFADALLRT